MTDIKEDFKKEWNIFIKEFPSFNTLPNKEVFRRGYLQGRLYQETSK